MKELTARILCGLAANPALATESETNLVERAFKMAEALDEKFGQKTFSGQIIGTLAYDDQNISFDELIQIDDLDIGELILTELKKPLNKQFYNDLEAASPGPTTRTYNTLLKKGFKTVADIASCSYDDILAIGNIGKKNVDQLELYLNIKGLGFNFDVRKYGLEPFKIKY